jgi:hypothetical protein
MTFAHIIPINRNRLAAIRSTIGKAGRVVVRGVRAFVHFWNIPVLGGPEGHRSPLLRHNWYI